MSAAASRQSMEVHVGAPGTGKYLTFALGQELLALGILRVKEILGYREPTAVLRMPAHIRGVINLRGTVIPVIDLDVRFGHPPRPVGRRSCILIVEADFNSEKHVLGIVVDAVNEVLSIAEDDVGPVPEFGGTIKARFLRGLVRNHGRFIALLDADKVFDLAELAELTRRRERSRTT
jgi:purine-binding chemotaxis protein CheW